MRVDALIKRAIRRSCGLSWAYASARYLRRSNHSGRPVVVYQMGKVGSTSAYRALQALKPASSIYHVHTLRQNRVRAAAAAYRATYRVRCMVPEHLLASRVLLQDLRQSQPRGRWRVITMIRDPIARNISSFFQDIELRHPGFDFNSRMREQNSETLVDDLLELFLDEHDHCEPLQWCDRELGEVLGIDVYAAPFDPRQGWRAYASPLAEAVLLRLEDFTRAWEPALTTLLGAPPPPLVTQNDASRKFYAEVYSLFKQRFAPSPSYVDAMYNSRFAKHFYSPEERERMAERWQHDPDALRGAGRSVSGRAQAASPWNCSRASLA